MDFCITKEFIEYSYQSENPLDVDDPDDGYNSFDEMFTGIDDSELNDDDKRFRIRVIKKIFEHTTDASMAHDCGSTIMWIIPKSSIAKNLMVKHGVAVNKRGRRNTWSLKVSEFSQ